MRHPRLIGKKRKNWQRFLQALTLACFFIVLPQVSLADVRDDFFRQVMLDGGPEVAAMLKEGVPPNLIEPKRNDTALVLALRENSMSVFRVLLDAEGVDVNHRVVNGDTALMIASWKENVEAARSLIDRGAYVNQHGWTALHYAAARGNIEILKMLLDKRADINARSPTHITPLMMAARNGKIHAVKLLLDHGADELLKDRDGRSVIEWAQENGHTDIADGMKSRLKKIKARRQQRFKERVMQNPPVAEWVTAHPPPMQ